jgi:hypothetical protein
VTPYTKPTHIHNPGPGKYNLERKKKDLKTKVLSEDTVNIPFGTAAERECNRKSVKH